MSEAQRKRAAHIIHGYALGASGTSAVLAQAAPANIAVSSVFVGLMLRSLIKEFKPDVEDLEEVATAVGGTIAGTMFTGMALRSAVGLVPVLGNLANVAMTFTMFETVGWGIYALLKDGRDIRNITKDEFKKFMELGKAEKLDIQKAIDRMPPHDKVIYNAYVEKLKNKDLPDEERQRVIAQVDELLDPYLDAVKG
jgi:hypothetical protein